MPSSGDGCSRPLASSACCTAESSPAAPGLRWRRSPRPAGPCWLEHWVSDHFYGDDHSLSPSQLAERISDALHPTIFLVQKLMPQRGSSFIQYPCLGFDPFTRRAAAHIARHYLDPWMIPYSFHLACVSERVDVEYAVFFSKPHRSRHGLACFPIGFQVEIFLVCKLSEAIGAHSGVFPMIERVRRTDALPPKRLTGGVRSGSEASRNLCTWP
jgi:hypothetical protein